MLALTFCSNTVVIGGRRGRETVTFDCSQPINHRHVRWRRAVSYYYYCARVTRGNFFRRKTLEEPLKKGRIKVSEGTTEIKNNKARAYCRYSRRLQLGALGRIIFFFCKNSHTRDFYRRFWFISYAGNRRVAAMRDARNVFKSKTAAGTVETDETERKLNSTLFFYTKTTGMMNPVITPFGPWTTRAFRLSTSKMYFHDISRAVKLGFRDHAQTKTLNRIRCFLIFWNL